MGGHKLSKDQYRFSGYNLNLVILDETGPAYAMEPPHPYYYNQPVYWQKNAYRNNQAIGGGGGSTRDKTYNDTIPQKTHYNSKVFRMLSF